MTKQLIICILITLFYEKGGVDMSICPKNRSSRARRDSRRANWKMSTPNLVKCSKCGALVMPHRVCKNCGSYNKREIVKVEA